MVSAVLTVLTISLAKHQSAVSIPVWAATRGLVFGRGGGSYRRDRRSGRRPRSTGVGGGEGGGEGRGGGGGDDHRHGDRKGRLMENAVVSEVAAAPAAAAALLSLGGGAQYGLGRDGARGLVHPPHTGSRFPFLLPPHTGPRCRARGGGYERNNHRARARRSSAHPSHPGRGALLPWPGESPRAEKHPNEPCRPRWTSRPAVYLTTLQYFQSIYSHLFIRARSTVKSA